MTRAILKQSEALLFPVCDDIQAVTYALIKDQIKKMFLFNKFTLGENIVSVYEGGRQIPDK